jgi:hypothetical protein
VVLEGHIQDAAHTQAALASGFAHTYWWVMAVTLVSLLPTLLLTRIERRARIATRARPVPAGAPVLEPA